MPRKTSVTIKDVAQEAGVSIATVSYVLNNADGVSDETRQRVLIVASELGYRVNVQARSLRLQESCALGYSWHTFPADHWHPILDRFLYGMMRAAEARGYHILTFAGGTRNDICAAYETLYLEGRVDGFILSDTNTDDPRIRYLLEKQFPFVAFGGANEAWDFPYVDVDGQAGAALGVEHLIALGHRRIGLLGWPADSFTGDRRFAGYVQALQAHGLDPNPAWIARVENSPDAARGAASAMLAAAQHPTALVCMSDMLAIGVMEAIYQQGRQPGRDVAVVGFDDIPTAQYLRPALSTIRQPVVRAGELVVQMLLAEIHGERLPERRVILQPELIVRESSGVLRTPGVMLDHDS